MNEQAVDFQLVPNGNDLRVRAPRSMSAEALETLRKHRAALLERYNERAALQEYEGGLARPEAERQAAAEAAAWAKQALRQENKKEKEP